MPDDVEFERVPQDGAVAARDDVPQKELAASWQRSMVALGGPENVTDVPQVSEEVLDAHLLDVFRAPLSRFADELDGTGLGVLLADSSGQILHRWCGDRAAVNHLDRIGTMRGADLSESAVGTNGVGTVVAAGRGLQIRGGEHFADFYRDAVCTGAPVQHPMTRNLMGVVTLSSDVTPRADLLRPMLHTVVETLEKHLLDMQQPAARRTFDAFLNIARSRTEPVIAFGDQGLLIQNRPAGGLQEADLGALQELCADHAAAGSRPVTLSCGETEAHITAVEPGNKVVLLKPARSRTAIATSAPPGAGLVGRAPDWQATRRQVELHRRSREPVLIAGEAGSGKLSLALGRPSQSEPVKRSILHAATQHVHGHSEWLRELATRLEEGRTVVVHGAQALDPGALEGLRALVKNASGQAPVFLTATAEDKAHGEALAMQLDVDLAWLPPLRERTEDVPLLWEHFAARVGKPPRPLVLLDEAEEILRAHPWPGNARGVRNVVSQLIAADHRGPVRSVDLPEGVQRAGALTRIERVELEAIRRALREAEGNRSRAASILGLSRATVYRKMKAYHLDR